MNTESYRVGDVDYGYDKFSGLDGRTKVTWSEAESSFKVVVTMGGVWFEGLMAQPLASNQALQDFARLVSDAWSVHRSLVPKIAVGNHQTREVDL